MAANLSAIVRQTVFAACLAAVAATAGAQSVPPADNQGGGRQRQRQNAQSPQPTQPVSLPDLYRGVACQAAADPASLEPMLATAPYSAAEREEAGRILRLIQRCQRGTGGMSASSSLLRSVIAETLYEVRFPVAQAARSPALAVAPLLKVDQATTRADAASLAPDYAMAACVAAGHAEPARALLASEPASPAEQAAFAALNPSLGRCLTGSPRLNFDLRALRGAVAESLYRWSVVQRDGPASPYAAPAGQ